MENLQIGALVTYKGVEFICLDVINGNYLLMGTDRKYSIPFDTQNGNDWRTSSLRRVLNNDFVESFDKTDLIPQQTDLVADNGSTLYGTCVDLVTILTCDQYRKYRHLINDADGMRLCTPRDCDTRSRWVRTAFDGSIYTVEAFREINVHPVILFSSKAMNRHLKRIRIYKCLYDPKTYGLFGR